MSAYGTVRGAVLRPGDGGHDAERTGFQTADPHRPEVSRCPPA